MLRAAVQVGSEPGDTELSVVYNDGQTETYTDWNEMFFDLLQAEDFSIAITIEKEGY